MKLKIADKLNLDNLGFNGEISRRDFCKKTARLAVFTVLPLTFLAKCGVTLLPDDTRSGILPFISFEIKFSKPMNKDSLTTGIVITPETSASPLHVLWSENDTVAYCKYYVDNDGTNYDVTLAGSITDTLGIQLDGDGNGVAGDPYPTFSITS